jgi:CheY-like chemotaxis protein
MLQREGARAEVRELRAEIDTAKSRLKEADAERQKLETEWNEKLSMIVNHLATDHEQDLGEAMLEKEAAKAEARRLGNRISLLQQKLEQERENFRVAKERWDQERDSLMAPFEAPAAEELTPDPHSLTVLFAHGDAGVRAMARHALEQTGYTVFTAADGLEAMRTVALYNPDILIAEAVMPKMNGRELVQLLKSRPHTASMKIIILKGAGAGEIEKGSDFQADAILDDAADFNALRAALMNVVTGK